MVWRQVNANDRCVPPHFRTGPWWLDCHLSSDKSLRQTASCVRTKPAVPSGLEVIRQLHDRQSTNFIGFLWISVVFNSWTFVLSKAPSFLWKAVCFWNHLSKWSQTLKTQPKDCHQGLHRSDVLVPCSVKDDSCGRCQLNSHVFFRSGRWMLDGFNTSVNGFKAGRRDMTGGCPRPGILV